MSKSIVTYLGQESVKKNIQDTLANKTPQFIASVASLVASNPKIAECEQQTILSSCLIAASLDLPINQNLGFAYIIPYRNKGVMQAQFQMGYKGFIQLSLRSNLFKLMNVSEVKEGELKGNNRLTGEIDFQWIENDRDSVKTVGYVAYFKLMNGFSKQLYMSSEQIKKHGTKFSQSFRKGYGLWKDDFDSMAKKTVLKQLISKYAPMNVEMQKAQQYDQAVIDGDKYNYPDNQPLDPSAESEERETTRIIKHIENSITETELRKCEKALSAQSIEVNEMFEKKLVSLNKKDS